MKKWWEAPPKCAKDCCCNHVRDYVLRHAKIWRRQTISNSKNSRYIWHAELWAWLQRFYSRGVEYQLRKHPCLIVTCLVSNQHAERASCYLFRSPRKGNVGDDITLRWTTYFISLLDIIPSENCYEINLAPQKPIIITWWRVAIQPPHLMLRPSAKDK